ncbi:MAG TPA: PLP-dependent aminotransferase family protein [Myxococcota bacterium]|jgi:GntR family transcriptional regulator/MocR family aminotransferase|nr:PLP-dependent aminotransferase family protein [Myxococcota bacterium]
MTSVEPRPPRSESLPVYRQIAERMRLEIEGGARPPGTRLPTIRALATELGVNRDTVALAYEELAAAGLIEATVGRGTFVRGGAGHGLAAAGDPFVPRFSPVVERVVDFDRRRPRYPAAADAVPLHALVPDPALYPVDAFRRSIARVLAHRGEELLRYGGVQGHAGLREVLAKRLHESGLDVGSDAIAITQGASEGISLALRLFAEPGDTVAVEEPTYHNVLSALSSLGLRAAPVPMRDGAADLGALERALSRPDVKLFYTMPTFHNPLGTSSSRAHREEVLVLAGRAGKPIVEDAYEMDLRYAGRPVPSLAALDRRGLVVQLFSFSKSLFPGARVGCITAPASALEALLALKHATDLGGALVLQAALADFVASGAYDRHLSKLRKTLLGRRDAVLEALAAEMPEGSRWTEPEGGHQVWLELPSGLDSRDLLADAARAGVLFAPGYQFHHDGRPSSGLRLSLALADEGSIRRGVAALGRVVRERMGESRAARGSGESIHV